MEMNGSFDGAENLYAHGEIIGGDRVLEMVSNVLEAFPWLCYWRLSLVGLFRALRRAPLRQLPHQIARVILEAQRTSEAATFEQC